MTDLVKLLREGGFLMVDDKSSIKEYYLESEKLKAESADHIEKLDQEIIRMIGRWAPQKDRIEKLEAALQRVLIGGNHLAILIGVGNPPHTATHEKALMHYGAGDAYEAWCCWKTIMEARKALEGKDG